MKLRTLLPALLLSLLTAACATAPDEADDLDSASSGVGEIVTCDATGASFDVELEQIYLDDGTFGWIDPLVVTANHDLVVDPTLGEAMDTDALCECADAACIVDWIDESLGCGVCAHVDCDGGEVGGCVACESVDEPAGSSCVFADAANSALE